LLIKLVIISVAVVVVSIISLLWYSSISVDNGNVDKKIR
jgi:hypothetical protein